MTECKFVPGHAEGAEWVPDQWVPRKADADVTVANRQGDWIQTYTGHKFFPFDPIPEEIDIRDIAHALSMQCRFTGHCKSFYSVAQHSVLVSENCSVVDAKWALLHDAPEAYLSDVSRPVKRHASFAFYKEAEQKIMAAICLKWGLSRTEPESVRRADDLLLATEARDFMSPMVPGWCIANLPVLEEIIVPLAPREAEMAFLLRYHELVMGVKGDGQR